MQKDRQNINIEEVASHDLVEIDDVWFFVSKNPLKNIRSIFDYPLLMFYDHLFNLAIHPQPYFSLPSFSSLSLLQKNRILGNLKLLVLKLI